ncbi:hypothetical protein AB0H36_41815 [Kribbella sp. NPDC050820]|uniref:hypothetical protein n=1 Tax=Kribbella sp. NPDC050820 TaxID=3155408 RepID=UPI0033CEE07C
MPIDVRDVKGLTQVDPALAAVITEALVAEQRDANDLARRQQLIGVLGILCGALISILFGYWSFLLLNAGHTIGGCVLGTGDLSALVAMFLSTNRRSR